MIVTKIEMCQPILGKKSQTRNITEIRLVEISTPHVDQWRSYFL